jgi:hypothetical protein
MKKKKKVTNKNTRSKTDEENSKVSIFFLRKCAPLWTADRPLRLRIITSSSRRSIYIKRATLRTVHLVIVVAVFKRHCFGIDPSLTSRIDFSSVFRHPPRWWKMMCTNY